MYNPEELIKIVERLNRLSLQHKDDNTGEVYSQVSYLAENIIIELDKLHIAIATIENDLANAK